MGTAASSRRCFGSAANRPEARTACGAVRHRPQKNLLLRRTDDKLVRRADLRVGSDLGAFNESRSVRHFQVPIPILMISQIHAENFAVFEKLRWPRPTQMNVLVGENDTGKSHLLKLLYGIARSVQEHEQQKAQGRETWKEVLARKLRETFQPPDLSLGKLVHKGEDDLEVEMRVMEESVYFSYGRSTRKQITDANTPRVENAPTSLFFPPKEVLTALDAIAATREQLSISGFGDTYLDLIKALRLPGTQGRVREGLYEDVVQEMETLLDGELRREDDEFVFRRGNEKYGMSQTAEGIKKIGILTHLIRNRSINEGSILFFDELEANLHPRASARLVEMLHAMSQEGIQVFIATHDYFVLKKLELIAREYGEDIAFCSLVRDEGRVHAELANLRDGMPDNPINEVSRELLSTDQRIAVEGR